MHSPMTFHISMCIKICTGTYGAHDIHIALLISEVLISMCTIAFKIKGFIISFVFSSNFASYFNIID